MANELSWLNDGYTINDIPDLWKPQYIIKRVNGEEIPIKWDTRNKILEAMSNGARYVQIGEITLMVNSINSIDPTWGQINRPPRPQENQIIEFQGNTVIQRPDKDHRKIIELWDKLFGKTEPKPDEIRVEKIKQLKEQNELA